MVENRPANAGDVRELGSVPGLGRCSGAWQPTPVFLAGEPHEQRSLVGYSPRGCKESDLTAHPSILLSFSYSDLERSLIFLWKAATPKQILDQIWLSIFMAQELLG